MIENDKKDNDADRKYENDEKSRGTTLTSWRSSNLQCSSCICFSVFNPLLKVCILSQLDERRSDDDGGEGETGAALSGTICWEIIVLIFHPLLRHSPPLLS